MKKLTYSTQTRTFSPIPYRPCMVINDGEFHLIGVEDLTNAFNKVKDDPKIKEAIYFEAHSVGQKFIRILRQYKGLSIRQAMYKDNTLNQLFDDNGTKLK